MAKPLLLLLAAVAAASAAPACAAACPSAGGERGVVAAVGARLELRLTDGRLIRLAGLDPAMPTPDRPDLDQTARAELAKRLDGRTIGLRLVSTKPDRWGRWPAFVFADGLGQERATDGRATDGRAADGRAADEGGIAGAAIAAGLARYLSEPAARPCREALLATERKARAAKLGLWADPYYGVLAVDDRAAFVERSGSNVLAEGRLHAVEPSPYRTTLRFEAPGSYGGHMLVATIPPRLLKTFKAKGMDPGALIGRRLRFRGLLDMRFGPRVELAGPDDVEMVETTGAVAAPAPPH